VTVFFGSARSEIADFVSAFVTVYVIVIIAWVVLSFIFAMACACRTRAGPTP